MNRESANEAAIRQWDESATRQALEATAESSMIAFALEKENERRRESTMYERI